MTEQTHKIFEGYLILNWRNKAMRIMARKPKSTTPFEIPIKLHIKVKIPEFKEIVARGEIEVPEHKVGEMVIESI